MSYYFFTTYSKYGDEIGRKLVLLHSHITELLHVCWQLLCTSSSTRWSTRVFSGNRSWGIDIQKLWQLKEKNMGKDALFLGIANLRFGQHNRIIDQFT